MAEKEQLKSLLETYQQFRIEYPEYRRQINDGLLILLAGGIKEADPWRVATPNIYRVELIGKPARWHCTCPQGAEFGPVASEFCHRPGRICKHVCAVVLALECRVWPSRPANLLEFLERLAPLAGEIIEEMSQPGEALGFSIPLANGVRVVPEAEGLTLKAGHLQSGLVVKAGEKTVNKKTYRQWVDSVKAPANNQP